LARITKLTPKNELKNIFVETLLNYTNKITKVSNNSVLSGVGYGVATLGQKTLVEVAAVEGYLSPEFAVGDQLDQIALDRGISARFGASGSSTFVRVTADPGTIYQSGVNTFSGDDGIVFSLDSDVTVGALGFAYAKVSSTVTGEVANVSPLTINTVSPEPVGHTSAVNEYEAVGGRDAESDDLFRKRIREGVNILARGTISSLEQVFIKINNNVLKIFNQGINSSGNIQIAVATQNGIDLTSNELLDLLDGAKEFVSLTEIRPFGDETYGMELVNIDFQPVDLNFRVTLESGYDPDTYRIDVQTRISKYLDFREFNPEVDLVEWDDLLQIAKTTRGAQYVPDQFFFVNTGRVDVRIDRSKLPRLRSFAIYDAQGVLIHDLSGNLVPQFFPNQ